MFRITRKTFVTLLAGLALGAVALGASAQQDFPNRPVRLVVSFPPGGAADAIARTLAQKLTERWKQQVLVDNRPGGNTVVAALEVIKQKPDGYTLFQSLDNSLVMNQHLFRTPKYDPLKDFTMIGGVAEFPLLLITRTDSGVKTAQEYLARARAEKGELKVGVAAVLTMIAADVLNSPAGVKTTSVQYKGTADNTMGLLRGDVDFIYDVDASAGAHVKAGTLKVLATSGSKRVPSYPDVPTYREVLGKDAEMTAWYGLVGPAGMDPALVAKINTDVTWAMLQPDVRASLQEKSLFSAPSSPEALRKRVEVDSLKYGEIIRRLNLQIE